MEKTSNTDNCSILFSLVKEIDELAKKNGIADGVFKECELISLDYTCPEAGFFRVISWLYSMHFESGKIPIKFLVNKIQLYDIDKQKQCNIHQRTVHSIRTLLFHSLNPNSPLDEKHKTLVKSWFISTCGSEIPKSYADWSKCLQNIFEEAKSFFLSIKYCLEKISTDEFKTVMIEDLKSQVNGHHAFSQFKEVAYEVANDIGYGEIDVGSFCRKHFEDWRNEIPRLSHTQNLQHEIRIRIERDILINPLLPISSSQIIQRLGVNPGPVVERLLLIGREYYKNNECSVDDLFDYLAGFI